MNAFHDPDRPCPCLCPWNTRPAPPTPQHFGNCFSSMYSQSNTVSKEHESMNHRFHFVIKVWHVIGKGGTVTTCLLARDAMWSPRNYLYSVRSSLFLSHLTPRWSDVGCRLCFNSHQLCYEPHRRRIDGGTKKRIKGGVVRPKPIGSRKQAYLQVKKGAVCVNVVIDWGKQLFYSFHCVLSNTQLTL